MTTRRTTKARYVRTLLIFVVLMIVIQTLGAMLFSDSWKGADDVLTIVGGSLLTGAIGAGIVVLLRMDI